MTSVETIGSSVYSHDAASSGRRRPARIAALTASDGRPAVSSSATRSTIEPSGTGTRMAMPSSLPFSSGSTLPDRLGGAGGGRDDVLGGGAARGGGPCGARRPGAGRWCRRAPWSSAPSRCRSSRAGPWRSGPGSWWCRRRCETIRCSGLSVVVVDPEHDGGVDLVLGRDGQDDPLGAGVQVLGQPRPASGTPRSTRRRCRRPAPSTGAAPGPSIARVFGCLPADQVARPRP